MGRRAVLAVEDDARQAERARQAVARYFSRLSPLANMAVLVAQQAEERMVETIIGFADDITLAPEFRRTCAIDVVTIARGKIVEWPHDGRTIDTMAQVPGMPEGVTTGQTIEAARMSSELLQRLTSYRMRRIPFSEWPEEDRRAAIDIEAAFADGEGQTQG